MATTNSSLANDRSMEQGNSPMSTTLTPAELLRSSIAALKAGKAAEAADQARLASEAVPNDPMPWILLATSEIQQGRLMAANVAIEALESLGSPKSAGLRQQWAEHRQRWANTGYARAFETQRHRYMDSPMAVAIESTGRCNAACSFCPHPSLDRRRTSMDDALFDKLVSDLSDLPTDRPVIIYPNVVNEPFMDRDFFDRFRRLMAAVPSAQLDLITKLNVVPKRFWDELWTLPRVRSIRLSFAAANGPEYEAAMNIDFDRTVKNLRQLLSGIRERGWLKVPVRLSRIADQTDGDRRYAEDCRTILEGFEAGKDYIPEVVSILPRRSYHVS